MAQLVRLSGVDVVVSLRHWTPYAAGPTDWEIGVSQESGTEGSGTLGPQASTTGPV